MPDQPPNHTAYPQSRHKLSRQHSCNSRVANPVGLLAAAAAADSGLLAAADADGLLAACDDLPADAGGSTTHRAASSDLPLVVPLHELTSANHLQPAHQRLQPSHSTAAAPIHQRQHTWRHANTLGGTGMG